MGIHKFDGDIDVTGNIYKDGVLDIPYEEITYSALKAKRDAVELVPGRQYRIIDYVTTTISANTRSMEHAFDIIVIADDKHTLNENARVVMHDNDTYFTDADAKLSSWQIKYSLDGDTDRFAWALDGQAITNLQSASRNGQPLTRQPNFDNRGFEEYQYAWGTKEDVEDGDPVNFVYSKNTTLANGETVYNRNEEAEQTAQVIEGKGVIYWMKDEFNNEAPYDFKNIVYYYKDYDRYIYTFGIFVTDNLGSLRPIDLSLNTLKNGDNVDCGCTGNIIKAYFDNTDDSYVHGYGKRQYLNNIKFLNEENIDGTVHTKCCYDNFFDFGCHDIEIGKCCSLNHFGHDCREIYLNYNSNYNTFGDDCHNIYLGNAFEGNVIEMSCHDINISSNCLGNRIGKYCYDITFDSSCNKNIIGMQCNNISLGRTAYANVFENEVMFVTFGSTSMPAEAYCYNFIESTCNFLYIKTSVNGNNQYLYKAHIHKGISGSSQIQRKSIVIEYTNSKTSIDVYAANAIEVILN